MESFLSHGGDIHQRNVVSATHNMDYPVTSPRPPYLDVRIRRKDGVGIVSASGEIDIGTATQLAESIAETCDQGLDEVVVDLREVTFMDCSGVRVIINARRSAVENGNRLTFIPSASVVRVLEILELEQLVRDPDGMDHPLL